MPFDVMDDEDNEQQYQDENGFRLPVPRTAAATPDTAPVKTASNPSPVPGTHIPGMTMGTDDAVNQAMTTSATRMPPAPPQDDQLSSLVQQRQQAGQPLDRTNPRYRMGFKERLSGALANFASGVGGGGVVKSIGPGAMNRKYYNDKIDQIDRTKNLDTAIGNREKLNEENRKDFDSATKQAFEAQVSSGHQDLARARQATADAQQQTADVKQQLANEQGRDITYNPQTKRFMKNGKIYVPKTVEEGASLEAGNGVKGYYTNLWSQERKNNAPPRPDHSASDAAKAIQVAEYRQRQHADLDKQEESERNKRYADLEKDVTLKYNADKMAAEKAKVDEALDTKYGPKHKSIDDEADGMLGLTKSGGPLKKGATATTPTTTKSAGKDFGVAPPGSREGRTGTLKDGTKVIVRKGRIVAQ